MRYLKKSLLYFLISVIAFANVAAFFVPQKASAASPEPTFDWSKEKWSIDSSKAVTHTVPYTLNGQTNTYTVKYLYVSGGTFAQEALEPAVSKETPGDFYRLLVEGSSTGAYGLVVYNDSVQGLFTSVNIDKTPACQQHFPRSPYLGFWTSTSTKETMNSCLTYSTGGTDTLYGWYIKKAGQHILNLLNSGNPVVLKSATINNVPAACAKIFIPAPLDGKLDSFFESMDPKHTLFNGKSPLSAADDKLLYETFYRSTTVPNYSDQHFLETSGYRNFVNTFGDAEKGLGNYWSDLPAGGKTTIKAAAAAYGAKAVGGWLTKQGASILLGAGSETAAQAGLGVWTGGTIVASAAVPLAIIAGTVATAEAGVFGYKYYANQASRYQLAKLIVASVYIPAHINFHDCMVQNKAPGFTQADLDQENKLWNQAQNIINQEFTDFTAAETLNSSESCGLSLTAGAPAYFIGTALCAIIKMMADISTGIIKTLFSSVFNAYRGPPAIIHHLASTINPFTIQNAKAADDNNVSSLVESLKSNSVQWPWVVPTWKFILGLTDLFLVGILLFLGIVNILHIQYDTYSIKKMLPLLIIGAILANFSLLIMRMMLDVANILTVSFAGSTNPSTAVGTLIDTVKIGDASGVASLGGLLIAVLFSFFALAAFLILGVMFYIRYVAILILAIAAPLAFIALAFPPTQSLFKQWWSWATKFAFMKPISFFFIFLAIRVKSESGATATIVGWFIIIILVYVAIIIPWKLGGAVMSMWGGAMGSIFGTKKGAWARKPLDDWWQRRKDNIGATAKSRFPGLFSGAEKDRMITEANKKRATGRLKENAYKRHGDTLGFMEGEAMTAESKADALAKDALNRYQTGSLKIGLWLRLLGGGIQWQGGKPKLKGAKDFAVEHLNALGDQMIAQKFQEKIQGDLLGTSLIKRGEENLRVKDMLEEMAKNGIGLKAVVVDKDGNLSPSGEKVDSGQKDENGQAIRIPKLMTAFDAQTLAQQIDNASMITDDPVKKRNLEKSAAELRQRAQQLMEENRSYNGEKINYSAMMPKGRDSRIFSIVYPGIKDDGQTMSSQMTKEAFKEMLESKGWSDRLMGISPAKLVGFMLGQNEGLNAMEKSRGAVAQDGINSLIRSGGEGGEDKGYYTYKTLEAVSGAFAVQADKKFEDQVIPRKILEVEEGTEAGSTLNTLAELVLKAKRSGVEFPGLEMPDFQLPSGNGKQQFDAVRVALAEQKDLKIDLNKRGKELTDEYQKAVNWLANHLEVFERIDPKSIPGLGINYAARYLRGVGTTISNTPIVGAVGGNPMGLTYQYKDKSPEKIFESIDRQNPQSLYNQQAGTQEKAMEERQKSLRQQEARDQRVAELRNGQPRDFSHDPSSATEYREKYQEEIPPLQAREREIMSSCKIGGQPVNEFDFEESIGDAIKNSVETTLRGVVRDLQGRGITIDLPKNLNLDDPAVAANFKNEVGNTCVGMRNVREAARTEEAQEILSRIHIGPSESVESLDKSLTELTQAFENLNSAAMSLQMAGKSMAAIPQSIKDQTTDALSHQAPLVGLSKTALDENPANSLDLLRRIIIGVQSARDARADNQTLTEQVMLGATNRTLKKMEQRMSTTGVPEVNVNVNQENAAGGGAAGPTAEQTPPTTPALGGRGTIGTQDDNT